MTISTKGTSASDDDDVRGAIRGSLWFDFELKTFVPALEGRDSLYLQVTWAAIYTTVKVRELSTCQHSKGTSDRGIGLRQ